MEHQLSSNKDIKDCNIGPIYWLYNNKTKIWSAVSSLSNQGISHSQHLLEVCPKTPTLSLADIDPISEYYSLQYNVQFSF